MLDPSPRNVDRPSPSTQPDRRSLGTLSKLPFSGSPCSNHGDERKVVHYHIKLCDQAGYRAIRKLAGPDAAYELFAMGDHTWAGHEALEGMLRG